MPESDFWTISGITNFIEGDSRELVIIDWTDTAGAYYGFISAFTPIDRCKSKRKRKFDRRN